jgi:predicted Zn-dependent protease
MNSLADSNSATKIEIGIVLAGPIDPIDQSAVSKSVGHINDYLAEILGEFDFSLSIVRRPELTSADRVEASVLLQRAVEDRDNRHWDFAFVVTSADLVGFYRPYCFAVLSRPLDAAVISLALIDPRATEMGANESQRVEKISWRLSQLILHALGHLSGLSSSPEYSNIMFHPTRASDLDPPPNLDAAQLERMRDSLADVADQRLEEGRGKKLSFAAFVARAAWINRIEIWRAIRAARPWEFPTRLSGLTIASMSTLAILYMTAEAWDLGLTQTTASVTQLACLSLIATTFYVTSRQQLLVRRGRQRSEQTVVTTASALGIVVIGMAVTWCALVVIGLSVSQLLFSSSLIASWSGSAELASSEAGWAEKFQMSVFTASIGLVIGSLGTSFESQNYFRHLIFVDEEI